MRAHTMQALARRALLARLARDRERIRGPPGRSAWPEARLTP